MKKIFIFTCTVLLLLSFCLFCSANNSDEGLAYEAITIEGFGDTEGFINPPVSDEDGYISDETFNEATDLLSSIREQYCVDVAFVIDSEPLDDAVQNVADDIFDYQGYGYNAIDGILLYVCMDSREFAYTTYGSAIEIFDDYVLEQIDYEVTPYLSDNDFDGAVLAYAKVCKEYLESYENGEYYENDGYFFENEYIYYDDYSSYDKVLDIPSIVMRYLIAIGIGAIVAFLLTKSKLKKMKTAVAATEANSYIKDGSVNVTYANDIFLYSNITKTPVPKQTKTDSGGRGGMGGGGMHTSSSGRSHGGRSGGF